MATCDIFVAMYASGKSYDEEYRIPYRKVGLIPGTSSMSAWNGRRNLYSDQRIKDGADLYNAGKVEWLVVSGGD